MQRINACSVFTFLYCFRVRLCFFLKKNSSSTFQTCMFSRANFKSSRKGVRRNFSWLFCPRNVKIEAYLVSAIHSKDVQVQHKNPKLLSYRIARKFYERRYKNNVLCFTFILQNEVGGLGRFQNLYGFVL